MKSILTIFLVLSGSISWAQANLETDQLYSCSDSSFSWDRIIVSEVEDKLIIHLNSGYNQAFTTGFLHPERKSGNGQITVDKKACNIQGNIMNCADAGLDISLRLRSKSDQEEIVIKDKISGNMTLSEITKKSITINGEPAISRSGELALKIPWDSTPYNLPHISIQVPCVREAFGQ